MNKKAISTIVATVLIILITVAAVAIIWAAIIPMIKNQLSGSTTCLDAVSQVTVLNEGYTCRNVAENKISLQVKRGPKSFDLKDIEVIVSIGGQTTNKRISADADVKTVPNTNQAKTYIISGANFGTADKVEIAPIVGIGGSEERCGKASSLVLRDCTPSVVVEEEEEPTE